jgi:hypothetical protein
LNTNNLNDKHLGGGHRTIKPGLIAMNNETSTEQAAWNNEP